MATFQWNTVNVATTIDKAKQANATLIVFVAESNHYETVQSDHVWQSTQVQQLLKDGSFVGLRLEKGSEDFIHFSQIFPVASTPMTLFIDTSNGSIRQTLQGQLDQTELTQALTAGISPKKPAETPAEVTASTDQQGDGSQSKKQEMREKVQRLQAKMAQRRQEKSETETEEAKAKDLARRTDNLAILEARRKQEELTEKVRLAEAIKVAQEARRVRRLAFESQKQKNSKSNPDTNADDKHTNLSSSANNDVAAASVIRKRVHADCVLAFRLPTGSIIKCNFAADEKLKLARDFVAEAPEFLAIKNSKDFVLKNIFPVVILEDDTKTFSELGLVPRAQIRVELPKSKLNNSDEGLCSWLMRMINPLNYALFSSRGTLPQTTTTHPTNNRAPSNHTQQQQQPPPPPRRVQSFRNSMDDEDEDKKKKAYNGNSQETMQ